MLVKGRGGIINLNSNHLFARSYGEGENSGSEIRIIKGYDKAFTLERFQGGKRAEEILDDIWRAAKAGVGYYEIPLEKRKKT